MSPIVLKGGGGQRLGNISIIKLLYTIPYEQIMKLRSLVITIRNFHISRKSYEMDDFFFWMSFSGTKYFIKRITYYKF